MPIEKLLSPAEIAQIVGVTEPMIRYWCRTEKIGMIDEEGRFVPLQKIRLGRRTMWAIPAHLAPTIKSSIETGAHLANTQGGTFYPPKRTRPMHSNWCEHKDKEGRRCRKVKTSGSFCNEHIPIEDPLEERENT